MATILAYFGTDLTTYDFNGYFRDWMTTTGNTPIEISSMTWPDVIDYLNQFQYSTTGLPANVAGMNTAYLLGHSDGDGLVGHLYVDMFLGSNLTVDRSSTLTGGTVTGLLGTDWLAPTVVISGISLSGASVGAATRTASTADDTALLARAFWGADNFTLSAYDDRANGFAGNDRMNGLGGNDELIGAQGNDTLYGGAGNDRLWGGDHNDQIFGQDGNDLIVGGGGADFVHGGNGNDTISGDAGRDVFMGGAGADIFVFRAMTDTTANLATCDHITDFRHGVDRINLGGIDASVSLAGNNAFVFVGATGAGFAPSGAITYYRQDLAGTANDRTIVYLDIDSDREPEAMIWLDGLHTLTASDFIL